MKKNVLLLFALFLGFVMPMSIHAQTCPGANRQIFNAKAETQYDAIGAALKNLLSDNTNAAWVWESGATFVENADGTARLQGILRSFQYPTTHRLQVDIAFTGRTFIAPAGSPVLMNTAPNTGGWYYYQWGAASMTGLNSLAGAKISLAQRGKSLQIGIGGVDQVPDVAKLGGSGWFTWTIVSQPTNPAIRINAFPAEPSIDQADLAFTLSGPPTVCTNDPCTTDVTPPTISGCPANINLTTTGDCANATWTAPTATDNCGTPTMSMTTSPTANLTNGGCFPIGTTTVTITATDAKGNKATCTFTVTVTKTSTDPCGTDVTPPTISGCPANINLTTAGDCANATWTAPTATDNCSTPTMSMTTSPTANLTNGGCFPIGTTTVTITATDAKGNKATCTFTVTVTKTPTDPCATDVTPPTISGCPANISLTTTGTCANATWTAPTATDNCSTPTLSLTTAPIAGLTNGGCFPVGTTTVTITATDAKGNKATCTFTVTVTKTDPCGTDVTPPTISGCPANISKSINTDCERIFWTAPTATDACSTPTLTFTTGPIEGRGIGSCYTPGVTTVTYTATDAKGNKSTCSFTITITTTCDNIVDPGKITGDQDLCRGGAVTAINSATAATGGSGAIEYLWMYSDGSSLFDPSTWTVVPNETGASLTNFPTLTKTTYFIRCVRRAGCLFYKESNTVTKTVKACLLSGSAFQSFNLVVVNTHQVRLDWITKDEIDESKYVVERSYDGINFMEIAQVSAKKQELNMYQFSDMQPKMGRSFYRVKHIETNGALDYTKVKNTVLYMNGGEPVTVYPNPVANSMFVEILDTEFPEGVIEVYNAFGTLVKTEKFTKSQARYEVNMNNIPAGNYILKIRQADGQVKSVKVTKF
jgi:HYR domain/Secretion system C-terminal sorting domain